MTRVLCVAFTLLVLTGCNSLTPAQQDNACTALRLGGYGFAAESVQRHAHIDAEDAYDELLEAVNEQCPELVTALPWRIPR